MKKQRQVAKRGEAGFGGSRLGGRRRLFKIRGKNVPMSEEAANRFFSYFSANGRMEGGQLMQLVAKRNDFQCSGSRQRVLKAC